MEAFIARAFQILIALGGAYILTLWFAIVVWTFQDIQARSRSVVAQIFSTLVVLIFSIPGLLIYMVLRPRYTLDDAFQRSLEEEYLMQDLEELPLCPGCQQYVEDDWVFCPNCRTELRDNCIACDRLIDLRWEICPFCGTEQYEDDAGLPGPSMQPVIAPSPQFLGQPQLTRTEVHALAGDEEERTRPIIPSTVRVDLRSGDVATEQVPELPISSQIHSHHEIAEPRRVSIGENGHSNDISPENRELETTLIDDTSIGSGEDVSNEDPVADGSPPQDPESSDTNAHTETPDEGTMTTFSGTETPDNDAHEEVGTKGKKRKRRSRRKKSRSSTRTGSEATS